MSTTCGDSLPGRGACCGGERGMWSWTRERTRGSARTPSLKVLGGGLFFVAGLLTWWQLDVNGLEIRTTAFDYTLTGIIPYVIFVVIAILTVLDRTDSLRLPAAVVEPVVQLGAAAIATLLVLWRFVFSDLNADGAASVGPWHRPVPGTGGRRRGADRLHHDVPPGRPGGRGRGEGRGGGPDAATDSSTVAVMRGLHRALTAASYGPRGGPEQVQDVRLAARRRRARLPDLRVVLNWIRISIGLRRQRRQRVRLLLHRTVPWILIVGSGVLALMLAGGPSSPARPRGP